jgi:hypothetical protein
MKTEKSLETINVFQILSSHEKLLVALRAMYEHFGTLEDNEMMNKECVRACKLAREAILEAKKL